MGDGAEEKRDVIDGAADMVIKDTYFNSKICNRWSCC